jgi:NitT/TauT family transport system permease protein
MSKARDRSRAYRIRTVAFQLAVVATILLVWQLGTHSSSVQRVLPFMDEYFISSPTQVVRRLVDMLSGSWQPNIWPLLATSFRGIVIGGVAGCLMGMLVGLALSHWATAYQIAAPYLVALNATPRLALIPIVVVMFGPTAKSTTVVSAMAVFFVTLFGALAGGRSVPGDLMRSSYLLGARRWDLMRMRWRYVTVWTFANLPVILTTAFIAGIFAELLSASPDGLGNIVRLALQRADATGTMALVVFLSAIGWTLVQIGRLYARRRLHWFGGGDLL